MEYDESNETVSWKVNPEDIDMEDVVMAQYVNIVKLAGDDPQKVGKN